MIGLVLVTHGDLADSFVAAADHVVGRQSQLVTICIAGADDMGVRRQEIIDAINSVDDGDGVIVMTDMFGGTPSNLAISAMSRPGVEVIAGLNLPMLIKFSKVRGDHSLDQAVTAATDAGRKYIKVASHYLNEKKS
jgi:PTS system mannose-specific IIA component